MSVFPVAALIKEIAAMARFNARTLAAALTTTVLAAYGAKAENYVFYYLPPCLTCYVPQPNIPILLEQTPKFGEPARPLGDHARMHPTAPGARGAHRRR